MHTDYIKSSHMCLFFLFLIIFYFNTDANAYCLNESHWELSLWVLFLLLYHLFMFWIDVWIFLNNFWFDVLENVNVILWFFFKISFTFLYFKLIFLVVLVNRFLF